jgi:hypothetical protein
MSIETLTRYVNKYNGAMIQNPSGNWVKFEEAVEASSNSLQLLKDEIADLKKELSCYRKRDQFNREAKNYDCY